MQLSMNGSGERVTVQGRVLTDHGRTTLVPSLPTGIDTPTGRQIAVLGALPAPEGSHVSVDGTLTGDELSMTGWVPDPGPDALHRFLRGADGAPRSVAVGVSHPGPEGSLIGVGMTTNTHGDWARVVHVAWATEETRRWVAGQPPRSVFVHAFVRDAGLPALLTSEPFPSR